MVRRDLVTRQEDPRDRRVNRVALAEHGLNLIRRVQRHRAEAQLSVMAALSEAERAAVMCAMALLAEAATRRRETEAATSRRPSERPAVP